VRAVFAIFNPVELYPPTLNGVEYLSTQFEQLTLVTHKLDIDDAWDFGSKVKLKIPGKWPQQRSSFGILSNFFRFFSYLLCMQRALSETRPEVLVIYEPHALLAYHIIKKVTSFRPKLLWYHSHDIWESAPKRRPSLTNYAARVEVKMMSEVDILSLPANERKQYYNLENFQGKYFYLPNYPLKSFYGKFVKKSKLNQELKIVYQGRICEGHGLEVLIPFLSVSIKGMILSLHLKGIVDGEYKKYLIDLAKTAGVDNRLFFYGVTSYKYVPEVASNCHVGIAIHTKDDIMNRTLGSSSNKIYEYAGVGLPVILYDNAHFKEHLSKFNWAFFTDLSGSSLRAIFERIVDEYELLSESAFLDFTNELNYEHYLSTVVPYIRMKLGQAST
jgi:hypothetical protein